MWVKQKVSFLLLAVVLSACEKSQQGGAPPAPPKPSVTVVAAQLSAVMPQREFVGRSEASQDVTLKARVGGNLIQKRFIEGSDVSKGDLLFEIDPAPYQNAVNQAKAQLEQARAVYRTAQSNFARGNELIKKNFISRSDYDTLNSNKLQAEAALSAAKVQLEQAELDLGYTQLHAPFQGRISRSLVFEGDLISAGQTELASLVQVKPMWVSFQVSEQDFVDAKRQHLEGELSNYVVKLRLSDNTVLSETGVLDYAANRVDATTGTLNLRARFDNNEALLVPGMYLTVLVESPEQQQALMIPQKAVQTDQQGRYVLVVDEASMIKRANVSLGERYGANWEVLQGINEGERVVTEGLQKVRIGIEVDAKLQDAIPFATPTP